MPYNTCQRNRPDGFDLARSPLEGFNLIDASAGTGKTYTICGLVLRLLLEKNLTIEQILVVTYTEAATEDLRGRIRQKLRQTLDAIKTPPGDDEFLQKYLATITDPSLAAHRLSEALRSFDDAGIFTIHAFCQRMLLEYSFESNALFDTELIADDSPIIREIIEDFWRRHACRNSKLFNQYAGAKLSPAALLDFLRPIIPHPFLHFLPDLDFAAGCGHLSDTETAYAQAYRTVCLGWAAARAAVSADLLGSPGLNRAVYRQAAMPDIISAMDDMAAACFPSPYLFDKFSFLASSRIVSATKTKKTPNILPFYELCEHLLLASRDLHTLYDRCLLAHKKKLLDTFRQELALRKAEGNVFSFDDLLQRLHAALAGVDGIPLARTIARKYPAALIDEFQDTDPLQFEIFKAIYDERSLLFLIGDPKQAIYSFRGADIFTYMDAAAESPLAHHTLNVNHRSAPALVKAVNSIFCRSSKPFVFESIVFQPVTAAAKQDPEHLTIDGRMQEPFNLWFLGRTAGSEAAASAPPGNSPRITKASARSRSMSLVGAEVCRLLNLASDNRACLGRRKLLPGDIAILVRTNEEARKMQQLLAGLRVPSVLHSSDDLFASDEAVEMLLLLQGIAAPHSIRRVKTGLLTRFMGLQADTVALLQANIPAYEKNVARWLGKFKTYHDLWSRYGFIQMFWAVMRDNGVRQRLLASENGERSLTNILHLAETLHQEAVKEGLNMTGLLGFLHGRLTSEPDRNIEHQLRLESDQERVKIVTIHKAKGLEYPVVFCPFAWEGMRVTAKRGCLFHSTADGIKTRLVFDAGSPEQEKHLQRARLEEMAENLRLLYVALTRAVHRCYLVWGAVNGAETSAAAYLLHQVPAPAGTVAGPETARTLMQQVIARFPGMSDSEILADLQALASAAGGTIRLSAAGEVSQACLHDNPAPAVQLQPKIFSAAVPSAWKISSFSSMTAGKASEKESGPPFHDAILDRDDAPAIQLGSPEQKKPGKETPSIFSFPQGAGPGTFLHELLEHADFSSEQPVAHELISEKLQQFGYETNWLPVIAAMLENLSNVQLHKDIPGLKLANLPRSSCVPEMEFYFPLSRTSPDSIKSIFTTKDRLDSTGDSATPLARQLDRLTFSEVKGYMRGFIDLIFEFAGRFYLVDWKSTYLGSAIENYHREKLGGTMISGFYFLQYHFYCLALHLHLQKRLPRYQYDSHFGGVFYIFLRGINQNLGPDFGIYHDRPEAAIIERLKAGLLSG